MLNLRFSDEFSLYSSNTPILLISPLHIEHTYSDGYQQDPIIEFYHCSNPYLDGSIYVVLQIIGSYL